jgi:flavin prenyltransferase
MANIFDQTYEHMHSQNIGQPFTVVPILAASPATLGLRGMMKPRIIVGISGASGAVYGVRVLELLRALDVETHLVLSKAGALTLAHETGMTPADLKQLADHSYAIGDVGAACSSGSFRTLGMIIAPCSMKTLAEIATGVSSTLLTRAADVALKERRRLVLLARETPLTNTHLKNMLAVSEMGGIIAPPVPAFYTHPASLAAMVDHTVTRALDLFGLDTGLITRWEGMNAGARADAKAAMTIQTSSHSPAESQPPMQVVARG